MSKFYERIKATVEEKTCPRHNKNQIVNVDNNNVMMSCCCSGFEIECYNLVIEILSREVAARKKANEV